MNSIFKQDHCPQCHQSVVLHQDKASSNSSQSTVTFQDEMEQKMGIKIISLTDIPAKSPDALPMVFCAFGLVKSALLVIVENTVL